MKIPAKEMRAAIPCETELAISSPLVWSLKRSFPVVLVSVLLMNPKVHSPCIITFNLYTILNLRNIVNPLKKRETFLLAKGWRVCYISKADESSAAALFEICRQKCGDLRSGMEEYMTSVLLTSELENLVTEAATQNSTSPIRIVLTIVFIVISVVLSALVLMQEGKTQGLGAISGAAETYWGKNKGRSMEGVLVKLTRVLSILFLLLAIVLNLTKF